LGRGKVLVLDPAKHHYYQPMFTLVGGGMKTLKDARRNTADVVPKKADFLPQHCYGFEPEHNRILLEDCRTVTYDYLVVAVGLTLHYDKIPGLVAGLRQRESGVCSNYSPKYVDLTYDALKRFDGGNAIFTFPNSPVKCAGAPQKIAYIAEEYLRKNNKRDSAKVIYNTSLPVIFGIKKYADALWKLVEERNIEVNLRRNLVEVRGQSNEAVFEHLDEPGKTTVSKYSLLHVTPPMSPPAILSATPGLTNEAGYLTVNKDTLQHTKHPNVFGLGDCTDSPNAKTAAAVAGQVGVLTRNLRAVMKGEALPAVYDGYTSCPLVTGYSKCILAEFNYAGEPMETFPVNQAKERRSMFIMKKDFMPAVYWHGLCRGYWNGPGMMRKLMHFGGK